MLVLKKVAITGGLSSGKSSVCRILKRLGAYTVSADEIVHQLLSPLTPTGHQVLDLLGHEILKEGHFDRAKMAQLVFANSEKLKALEKILHPAVLEAIHALYLQVKAQDQFPLFVAEVPLLFESESHLYFDKVIAVIADEKLAKKRFTQATHYTYSEFERRMARQLDPQLKAAKADFTLANNGTMADLEAATSTLYQHLRRT